MILTCCQNMKVNHLKICFLLLPVALLPRIYDRPDRVPDKEKNHLSKILSDKYFQRDERESIFKKLLIQ